MELYENCIGIRFKVSAIVVTGHTAWRIKMSREDSKRKAQARQRIWEALGSALPRIKVLGGLHESDLDWIARRALSLNKSITLKIERESDEKHIRITLEAIEKK